MPSRRNSRTVAVRSRRRSSGAGRTTGAYRVAQRAFGGQASGVVQAGRAIMRQAAIAAANRMLPGAGTALSNFDSFGRRIRQGLAGPKRSYNTRGIDRGPFRKARKSGIRSKFDVYASKGFVVTNEIAGTISDPQTVYITHNSYSSYTTVEVSILALMRKLFMKAGLIINGQDEEVPNIAFDDAAGYKINLIQQNMGTGVQTVRTTYTTVNGDTIAIIAGQFFLSVLQWTATAAYSAAGSAANMEELIKFELYNGGVYKCALDLRNEIIHIKALSEIKVQNRTKAASGSGDSEDVSNNPLQGYMYEFSGTPKTRSGTGYLLNGIPVDTGVALVRAAQVGSSFKEPPLPRTFWNVTKSSKLRLNPGDIKRGSCLYTKNISYLKWLKMQNLVYGPNINGVLAFSQIQASIPCQMICLEDVINVNLAENISCGYEVNRQTGVYFTTRRLNIASQYSDNRVINNDVP